MSIIHKTQVKCKKCLKEYETSVFESVNTEIPNLIPKVIDGSFFTSQCPFCNNVAKLEYDTLFNYMERKAMIFVSHELTKEKELEIRQSMEKFALGVFTYRIVLNMPQLREKVCLLYRNRDDRIVEIIKKIVTFNLGEQVPDFKVFQAFYDLINDEEILLFYNSDGQEIQVDFVEDLYNRLKNEDMPLIEELSKNKLIIDSRWANQFLMYKFKRDHIN